MTMRDVAGRWLRLYVMVVEHKCLRDVIRIGVHGGGVCGVGFGSRIVNLSLGWFRGGVEGGHGIGGGVVKYSTLMAVLLEMCRRAVHSKDKLIINVFDCDV